MKCYQITEITEQFHHAGTKATSDIAAVAERLGFTRVPIRMNNFVSSAAGKILRQVGYLGDWENAYRTIEPDSVVLLQHPFHHKQLTRSKVLHKLKELKRVRYISLVHDVEELRAFRYSDYYADEFQDMLDLADVMIVHNQKMKDWFVTRGVPSEKLISLEIFDYLQPSLAKEPPSFAKSITVAGNLDTEKCGYIAQLGQLSGVSVNLFGPNYNEQLDKYKNIHYRGSFPVNEIPSKLKEGFGLVWDGDSIDGCQGLSGQYLRYNNPHKLSLYLSSGLPVVIWSGAAEAEYVEANRLGIVTESLSDLPKIFEELNEESYREMCQAVSVVQAELQSGQYTTEALQKAAKYLGLSLTEKTGV